MMADDTCDGPLSDAVAATSGDMDGCDDDCVGSAAVGGVAAAARDASTMTTTSEEEKCRPSSPSSSVTVARGASRSIPAARPSKEEDRPTSFGEAFAPLAHHLFPDGLPREGVASSDSSSSSSLSECWPTRTDRLPVSHSSARASLGKLRRLVSSISRGGGCGFRPGEILALSVAACATLPRRQRWGDDSAKGGVVAGGGSPLVDGTTRVFVDIVRLMIPSSQLSPPRLVEGGLDRQGEEVDAIPAEVIRMLLSAAASSGRCDARGRRAVLRFLTLAVRSGRLRRRATPRPRPRPQHAESTPAVNANDLSRGGGCRDSARSVLSSLYSIPFSMLDDPETAEDAVRLLHAITRRRHATPHRARRVRRIYDGACGRNATGANTPPGGESGGGVKYGPGGLAPLVLLLQLYARYDPTGCGRYFPRDVCLGGSFSRYFRFPDQAWERDFMSPSEHGSGSTSAVSSGPDDAIPPTEDGRGRTAKEGFAGAERGNDDSSSPGRHCFPATKRPRREDGRGAATGAAAPSFDGDALIRTIERLEDAFDGVGSSSWSLLLSGGGDGSSPSSRAVRVSDLLADESLRHLILLSSEMEGVGVGIARGDAYGGDRGVSGGGGGGDGVREDNCAGPGIDVCDTEVARLRACLPHMLYDEWYEEDGGEGDDAAISGSTWGHSMGRSGHRVARGGGRCNGRRRNRLRVMEALSEFAAHADALPAEAETFILEEVLPNWDGGEDEIGDALCSGLLPALGPTTFSDLERRVLGHLGKMYVLGPPKLKHLIVSGALSSLVRRWGRLVWPSVAAEGDRSAHFGVRTTPSKIITLNEVIHWTDNLLLTGLIAEGGSDGGGHELVRLSALDFLEAVCGLSERCDFVFSPSAALLYRLLLSSTALCIDRVCGLLLRYKNVFEDLKNRRDNRACNVEDAESQGDFLLTQFGGLERCVIHFNCFIWDYCSVLWRCSPLPSAEGDAGESDMSHKNSILFTDLPRGTLQGLRSLPGDLKVASALSITHGAVFSGYASDFLEKQRSAGKLATLGDAQALSPDLLTGMMKAKYLDHLRDLGFVGIFEFLTTFVGSLAARESRRAKKRQAKRKA